MYVESQLTMKSPLLKISSIVRLHVHCGREKYGIIIRVYYSCMVFMYLVLYTVETLLN